MSFGPRHPGPYYRMGAAPFLAQMHSAGEMRKRVHARLIAEGYEWEGMDGYSKVVTSGQEEQAGLAQAPAGPDAGEP